MAEQLEIALFEGFPHRWEPFRRWLARRHQAKVQAKQSLNALLGRTAEVVLTVNETNGKVKLGGELWSARSLDASQVLEPGQEVTVMNIFGATAIVWGEP